MDKACVVAGRIADSRHIELEEPVTGLQGRVEVTLRSLDKSRPREKDVMDLIRSLPAGTRTKRDIDLQVEAERKSWGEG